MKTLRAAATLALLLGAGSAWAQPSGSGHLRLGVEALAWWFKGSPTPTALAVDAPPDEPGGNVLLGGGELKANPHAGLRLTAGFAPGARLGIEASVLWLAPRSSGAGVSSSGLVGSTDLLLPYFDVLANREAVTEISLAPIYDGAIHHELQSRLYGAELNGFYGLGLPGPLSVEVLGGVRWLRLKETYTITTESENVPPLAKDVWQTTDRFDAANDFYGVQAGVRARGKVGPISASAGAKLGVGAMRQKVDVDGFLVTNDFTNLASLETYAGGYFASPANIGSHSRTVLAIVPEVRLDLGFAIAPGLNVFAGYTLLYMSAVARPGEQVDRNVDPAQSVSWTGDPQALASVSRPSFSFHGSSFWAQGVNAGISLRF